MARDGMDRRDFLKLGAGAAVAGVALSPGAVLAQAAAGGKTLPLTIAATSGDTGGIFIELLNKHGFLTKYGLDTEFVQISDGGKIVSALVSGAADICRGSGFGQTLVAISQGADLRVLGGANVLSTQAIYSAKPDIRTLKDLEGRVVGTGAPGALLHHMTVALLRKKGIDVDKVQFVNVGSSTNVFRAVAAGTVDAGPAQNNIHDEQEKYGVHSIAEFWTELPEYTYQACYASAKAIREKREALVRAIAAFKDMYDFIQSDTSQDAYVEAYLKASGDTDANKGIAQWRFFNKYKPYDVQIPVERIDYMQKLNVDAGIQSRIVPIEEVVDLSLLDEALKLSG